MEHWPGERGRRDESGLPLGGIGAGKIEFCPDGRFTNVTINNNMDCPIVDGAACAPPEPRIKEGFPGSVAENAYRRRLLFAQEGLPGAWLAVHTPLDGARVLKTVARPAFTPVQPDAIEYDGCFPRATVSYRGLAGARLHLDAFSSFDLVDASEKYRNSALPLALFVFEVENLHDDLLPVTLVLSWQNLNGVGGYAGTLINQPDSTPPVFRDDAFAPGLWFDHTRPTSVDPRVAGDYSVRVWSDVPDASVTYCAGWDPRGSGHDVWDAFAQSGRLSDGDGPSTAGALGLQAPLAAGARGTVVFALSWHVPHLLAAETCWEHLVRPSSAPPMPTSPGRRDYGHVYSLWFENSWAVAEYGLQHWRSLRSLVSAWQDALANSVLPSRFVTALCNDLFPLFSNTWYTRDGKYAVNEAPTDMKGCMGTLDQRSVGNAAVACAFPDLDRAELELFAADQVRTDGDPRRWGTHWNARTGQFDLSLDRAGAILHDVGWDHLEGGRTGDARWSSAHWPELSSEFVLQVYQHAIWTGDADWLDTLYPHVQEALRFQARLDQDGDGVADLWGPGSNTYDTELYPYFGACPFVATLYLAALRAAERMATDRGDLDFAAWSRERFLAAQHTLESELWDEARGYYLAWRDTSYQAWAGPRAHAIESPNCHVSQLVGAWWTDLLCLGDVIDPARRRQALESIGRLNVGAVPGAPANEFRPDGSYSESFPPYALVYFAAQAIAAGLPNLGWQAVEKTLHVRYELDGSPWDAPLQLAGEGNYQPQWGRWYMSHPASWYLLLALSGVRLDRLHDVLWVAPSWPEAWGDTLRSLPVFLPGFQAQVDAQRGASTWQVSFRIRQLVDRPLQLASIGTRLPEGFDAATVRVSLLGIPHRNVEVRSDGRVVISGPVVLGRPDEGFTITVSQV